MTSPIIVWFRQDLRRADNPALYAAYEKAAPIIPLYMLDDENAAEWKMGAASRVWLHHALKDLDDTLSQHLLLKIGKAEDIFKEIIATVKPQAVYWNRCYEPWRIKRDKQIKSFLEDQEIEVKSFNGSLIWEPWTIKNQSGEPYKVFTPFYRKGCLGAGEPKEPLPAPKRLTYAEHNIGSLTLDELDLLPEKEGTWPNEVVKRWKIGEDGAHERLKDFLEEGLNGYKEKRNNPALPNVSRLSPHLHWGHISPRQVWHAAKTYAAANKINEKDIDHFCSELGWREFSHNLLYYFPDLPRKNLQSKFDNFPWREASEEELNRWRIGQTGYPIVDAAMRELYQTGYMHNRTRMIVGSFLVKHMMVHWHYGEDWFWDCLFDADLANNSASWQWIAGCGADAAPYFRIFNPMTQGEKFDSEGTYIRQYVPELKNLPDKYLNAPWDAPADILTKASVKLGETYPEPLVDHMAARDRALKAFESLKGS